MIDFFDKKHNPQKFHSEIMWCADERDSSPAYVTADRTNPHVVACIRNEKKKTATFVAIDNNIDLRDGQTNDKPRSCDGMLYFDDALYFIELKKVRQNWIEGAKEQLISTIRIFRQYHILDKFKRKRAYACNKNFPNFHVFEFEQKHQFKNHTGGFILFADNNIKVL